MKKMLLPLFVLFFVVLADLASAQVVAVNARRTPIRNALFGRRQAVVAVNASPFVAANVVASPVIVRNRRAFITTPFVSGLNVAQPVVASGGFIQPQLIVNPAFVDPRFRAVRQFATPGFVASPFAAQAVVSPFAVQSAVINTRRVRSRCF